MDVTASLQTSEMPSLNAALGPDYRLMKAHLLLTQFTTNSITVSEVPFAIYDVVVYSDGDNMGVDRVLQFRHATNNIYLRDAVGATFAGIYAPASGTADQGVNTPAGNYVRFNGMISNSFTIAFSASSSSDGTPTAVVNAIQIIPSVYSTVFPPQVTRGPYLQSGGQTRLAIRWRTNRPVNERVRYGTNEANLEFAVDDPTESIEHSMLLTNLQPGTRYY